MRSPDGMTQKLIWFHSSIPLGDWINFIPPVPGPPVTILPQSSMLEAGGEIVLI